VSPNDQGDVVDGQEVTSRRRVLIGGASLAAMAWAAPAITRLPGGRALATPPPPCEEPNTLPDEFNSGSGLFIVPAGVTQLRIHAWGAGGGVTGGDRGGGGGGAYSSSVIQVAECEELSYVVGAGTTGTGGTSSVLRGEAVLVRAEGGAAGNDAQGPNNTDDIADNWAGIGGVATNGVGDIRFSGGNGATRRGGTTGGGGGSAGNAGDGGNAIVSSPNRTSGGIAGAGSPSGAAGGAGGSTTVPTPGGGAGGNASVSVNGASGRVLFEAV
jgi:hypothetical protein